MKTKQRIHIRDAQTSDAATLAELSGELGYPTTAAEMKRRVESLRSGLHHGIFVAEHETLLGWIHVSVIETLESEPFAEIRGLVVSESHRGSGIGTQLVVAAEHWAHKKGCKRIRVRTNVMRTEARAFYKKLGYLSKKTQEVFDKVLASGG
ncbi:MAG: GNAT family N-acetyltransferase [Bacteroidota bacterium]